MTVVRVKGFKIFIDRLGKRRCYHRKTGKAIDLDTFPFGTLAFFGECKRIADLLAKNDSSRPGTLGSLITKYRASPEFKELAARTQADYQKCFDYLKAISDTPLVRFNSPLIVRLRDVAREKHGIRFANYIKSVFSLLFAWAKERGFMRENPASDIKAIKRPKHAPDANRPWSDTEREAVLAALPGHMKLPISLMMFYGLDPQDALKLPRTAVKNGMIDTKRGKTGVSVMLPIFEPVADAIAAQPVHSALTLCANSHGAHFSKTGQ